MSEQTLMQQLSTVNSGIRSIDEITKLSHRITWIFFFMWLSLVVVASLVFFYGNQPDFQYFSQSRFEKEGTGYKKKK